MTEWSITVIAFGDGYYTVRLETKDGRKVLISCHGEDELSLRLNELLNSLK